MKTTKDKLIDFLIRSAETLHPLNYKDLANKLIESGLIEIEEEPKDWWICFTCGAQAKQNSNPHLKPVFICSECDFVSNENIKEDHIVNSDDGRLYNLTCSGSGTLQPYFSASDIENLIKGRRQELIMKTMYDGSMGVMVDPDLSVYNELTSILAALEGGEG